MDVKKFQDFVKQTWVDLPKAILSESAEVTQKISKVTQIDTTVPHMSTSHIGLLISLAASCLGEDESYVNIGTWKGYSFFTGFIDNPNANCLGNDNFSLFTEDRSASTTEKDPMGRWFGDAKTEFFRVFDRLKNDHQKFVDGDWVTGFFDKFNEISDKKIGFYFYDGDHSYEAQYKALKIVQPFLSKQCVILIDDTNREQIARANSKFLEEHKDFKMLYNLPTPCNRYPTWWDGLQVMVRE